MPAVTVNDLNNAQLDVNTIASVATSTAATVTDRLGNTKNTLSGMNAAVLASAAAVQGSIGYLPPMAYAAGINLTLAAQTVSYTGQTFAPLLSALPFTTSGTFETAKFRLIQGVAAIDLAAPTGAGLVGYTPAGIGAVTTTVKEALRAAFDKTGALIAPTANVPVTAPPWATYNSAFFPVEFNLNSFPHTSTNGNNVFGTVNAITGLIDTPSTDTVWTNSINCGVAGYARSASPVKGSVGVFGSGMSNANNTQQWGANFVGTNFNAASGNSAGQIAFYTCGMEADVYINGTGLTGTVIGVKIAAAISSIPSGGAYGIEIAPANVAGTLGWSAAIAIDDAPNSAAISVGAAGAGASKNSQSITFKSSTAGSVPQFATLFHDTGNNFNIQTTGATKLSNLQVNGNSVFLGPSIILPALSNYASDTAAAAGGIAVNQVYRNGSALMARVS